MSRTLLSFSAVMAISLSMSYTALANAEAAHPLIRPPISIKPTKAQMPMSMIDVITKKTVGLEFEDASTTALAMKQAKDYIDYRKGAWSKTQISTWDDACENEMSSKTVNPYCRIEQERALAGGGGSLTSKIRNEKRSLAESLRAGDFAKADSRSYSEVIAALGSTGGVESVVLPLARTVAAMKSCVPGTVPTAMGYKLEELFPDKDMVELAKTLYRKGVACGKDMAQASAAFRLGLILIWQNQYADIDDLMKKVEAVPEASMLHARAGYWRYQAAIAMGNAKLKAETKEALLRNHPLTFQNLAANGDDDSMMTRVVSREMPSVFTRSLIRPDVNPVLRAAEALERAGSPQLAAEVLDRSVGDIGTLEPEVRLYTAAFLHRIGYSLPKFKILSSLFQDSPRLVTTASMELMFPLSYFEVVRKKQNEMDPLLFLSLMRQESAFNPEAMSGVGARGLMQLMPATARGIRRISKQQLFQPEINIEVGTKYFLNRLAEYSGDVELTLAAYNAGFARVDQWRKRYPTENKLLFLDFIPFRETRDYVSAILRNYYWYVRLYAPDTSAVALESGKIQTPGTLPGLGKMQSILAANAGNAARLVRVPTAVAPARN
jgi:soluble lytic murein transglycosylase-like protein